MGSTKLVLLWAFVASAVAVPVSHREQCARHCTESNQFVLNPGSTYTYDYETTTVTTIKGTSQDKSQLQMTAQVDIQVLSKCELSLRLRSVTLKQSDPQNPEYLNPVRGGREFSTSVEGHILKFSYQDGRIEHICPTEETPAWVTNIQRGALSAFQTSMANLEGDERVIETDVSGKCSAEYRSLGRSWRGTITILKVKDLNTCTDRQNADTSLQSTPYTQGFVGTKSLPIVTGSQECEQIIGSGFLQSSSCTEEHVFRPFSRGGGGAHTTVTQKLTFNAVSQRSFTGDVYRPTRKTMTFDHAYEATYDGRQERDAETAMTELCDASTVEMSITVPTKFASLVYSMRKLEFNSIVALYKKLSTVCPNNAKAEKFFTDAVPLVGTSSSVRFMTEMILRQEVPQSEVTFWLTSLSFITEPTSDMIATVTPLLDGRFEQGFLGASALIHAFCKTNDCSTSNEVRDAVFKLVGHLGDNCYSSEDRKVLLTLKALGNIGELFGRAAVLERCYKNPQIDIEIRIAAIQTYRRLSCDLSREHFLETYGNYDEDTEIRIASYLASMTCLNQEILQHVKQTLEKEAVNQVGSFVWTHLNALSKSKHPERRDIRDILSSIHLLNKYNTDIRKFSSAYEASAFLESINSGFHADSHIIFTPESYLPRSSTFNLTVDIFGQTCNLFQVDGRMEGLENIVEKFFGPSGYFPQRNVAKLLRERRSISDNKIEKFDQQFDIKSRFGKQPYGSLDMKVFGNTLFYSQFGRNDDESTSFNLMDLVSDLAREQEKEFSRSFMFMDTTFTIPMASGMPLRLAVNGTATVGLKIGGKFNVRSFQHVDILGHFEPSGAVEIASLLTVEAGTTARTGLRMIGTLHSSSVLDGSIEVRNGQVFKVQLNMPRDKIELIDIQSKLFLVHGPEEAEQRGIKEDTTTINSCTGQAFKKVLGMELCAEVRLPSGKRNTPLYPMNGPATFSIYARKTDPSLVSYTFDSQWNNVEANGQYVRRGIISLNTPGTTTDRELSVEFLLDQPERTASFKLKTPFKKFGVNAKYENEKSLKKLDLSLIMDEVTKFSLLSEFKMNTEKGGVRYLPSLEIRIPSRRIAAVSGSAYLKYGQKYSAQLNIEDLTEKPIILKGDFDIKNRDRYEGKITMDSFALETTIDGYTQLGDTSSCRFTANYRLMEGQTSKISINGKLRDLSANALMKHSGVLNVQSTALPEWDTALSWETMKTTGHFENTLSIAIGDGVRSRVHTINLQEIIRYRGELLDNSADVTMKLAYPEKDIDYSFTMKHENTHKSLKNLINVIYAQGKEFSTLVDIKADTSKSLALSGDFKVQYPGRETRLTTEITETAPNEYHASVLTQWQRGKRMQFVGNYKDKTDNTHMKHEVDAELVLSGHLPMTMEATIGASNDQYALFSEATFGREKYRLTADFVKGTGLSRRFTSQLLVGKEFYAAEASLQSVRDKITGSVEIKLPNRRRITAKANVRNSHVIRTASFETMWDADRDQNRRFAFDAEVLPKAAGFDSKASVQVLKRTIKGSLSCSAIGRLSGSTMEMSHKAELEWSPTERVTVSLTTNTQMARSRHQINGNLDVTTPFRGYESVTVNVAHSDSDQQWNSQISTLWDRTNRIILATNGRYSVDRYGRSLYANAKLQTPFNNWESMSVDLTHARGPAELSSRAEVQWRHDKKIAAGVFGSLAGNEFRGGANLTTPFPYARDMYATVLHTYSSDNYKTKGEVQWARNSKIVVDFDGRSTLSSRRRSCLMNLVVVSPFRGYETVSGKVVYNNDGTTLNTDAEVNINRDKVNLGYTGTSRNSPHSNNMDYKLYFNSPFTGYERLEVSTTLQTTGSSSYKTNVDAKLPYRMAASLNSQGKMTSLNDMEMNVVVSGKFGQYINFQRASVDFAHKLQEPTNAPNLRSSLDLVYNDKQMTALLTGRSTALILEGTLTINTPFKGFEEMKLDLMHGTRISYSPTRGQYETRIQFSKNNENLLINHEHELKGPLTFDTSIRVTSTFSNIGDFKASISQEYTDSYSTRRLVSSKFQHSTAVEWGTKMKKVVLNILYQNRSPSKDFTISLTTPYHQLRDLEVSALYEESRREYKPSLSIQWNGNRKMTLESSLMHSKMQKAEGKVIFTSPFYGHELYQISGKYDLTRPTTTAEIELQWDRRNIKEISLRGIYTPSEQKTSAEVILATPFNGFEQIMINGDYENQRSEKSASLTYQSGYKKISLNGKSILSRDGAEIEINFNSPYKYAKDLSLGAKYSNTGRRLSGETKLRWDSDQTAGITGEYTWGSQASVTLQRNSEQLMQVSADGVVNNGEAAYNVKVESSFPGYNQMSLYGHYGQDNRKYNAEVKIQHGPRNMYQGKAVVKHNRNFPTEITISLDSPNSPFRKVRFTTTVTSNTGHHEINSNLRWEDKEMNAFGRLRSRDGRFYESKFELNTPFENFPTLSLEGSLQRDSANFFDGRLKVLTPFDTLRSLDLSSQMKSSPEGYNLNFNMDTPSKKLEVTANLKNSRFQPFEARLNVNAPFTSFKTFSVSSKIESRGIEDTKALVSVITGDIEHTMSASFQKREGKVEMEVKMTCPYLKSGESKLSASADYSDMRSISGKVSCMAFGSEHVVEVNSRSNRRDQEMEIKLNSPALPGRKAALKATYSYHRSGNMAGRWVLNFADSVHQMSCRYENDNRQHLVSAKLESNLIPFRVLNTEAKYINMNGRDIEVSAMVSTPESKHAITGNLKNYDNEKIFEVKIECPLMKMNTLTVSGSFKNENFNNMEAVITIDHARQELRIAGNINGIGSENMEAMVTMNTPFDCLRMMRIDTKFYQSQLGSIESDFKLETSNPNFRKLSFSGKLGRTRGSEELSINLQIPNTRYHTMGLLANLHYNTDYTAVSTRTTLSLLQKRYSVYGDYKLAKEYSMLAGCSWDSDRKMEISTNGKYHSRRSFEGQVSVKTPFQGYENYQSSLLYTNDGRRQEVNLGYKNPQNKAVDAKGTLEMTSPMNFFAEGSISSSLPYLRGISARIRQTYNHRSFRTDIECNSDRERGELSLLHHFNDTHYIGNFEVKTPFRAMKEFKTSYNFMASRYERQVNADVFYNRVQQMAVEVSSQQKSYQMVLDFPRLPFNLKMNADNSESEQKFSFRSTSPSRTVYFGTMLQATSHVAMHETRFSWDEESGKTISYNLKSTNIQSRHFRGRELYGRLDFPLRSFEVKGNIADFAKSFGFDVFWDAARDRQKHMTFGYEHHDINNRDQTTHKIKLTLTHPSLSREIVMTNVFVEGAQEFHLKSDLEYSRHQQHRLSVEVKGSEHSEYRRESMYKGEVSLKHPASFVDVRVVGEVANSRDSSSLHLRLNNMDNQRAQRTLEFKSRVTKSSSIHLMMRSDESQVNIFGRKLTNGYEIILTPSQESSDDNAAYATCRIIQNDKAIDVKITVQRNRAFEISATYPTDSMSLKISHSTDGKVFTDGHVFLGIEQSRILKSRINWRPGMLKELQYETGNGLAQLSRAFRQNYGTVSRSVSSEVSQKSGLMSRHFTEQLMPLFIEAKQTMNDISSEVQSGRDAFYTMYRRNEFYMKDITHESQRIFRAIGDGIEMVSMGMEVLYNIAMEYLDEIYYDIHYAIEDFVAKAKTLYKDMMYRMLRFRTDMEKMMYRTWRHTLSTLDHAVEYSLRKMALMGDSFVINVDRMLRSYAPFIIDMYYYAKNVADGLRETIQSTTDRVTTTVTNNPYYIALSEYYNKVMATFEAFRQADVMEIFNRHVTEQYDAIKRSTQAVLDQISDLNLIETVMNHPHVEFVGDITNTALTKGLEMYNTLGIDAMMRSLVHTGFEYAREVAFDTTQELLHELYQLKSGAKYSIAPERGHLSFEYTLPVSKNSLVEVLDIHSYPEYRRFNDFKNTLITKYYEDFCIWDMYYATKKYFTPRYYLPLTPAHAMIAGNQHFITFDKFAFDFASECSYLLTRDFVDGNFSVVVNYGKEGRKAVRKSLTVLSEGKKFEVSNDYKVTVDDVKVEMPLQRENTVVTREGSDIRIENDVKGFVVVCNFVHDVCTLGMSSFYFGKTGGLFGTYDYEPRLDMMTPEKRITSDVETFVNSWEVGDSTCVRSSNMATIPGNDYRVQEKCKELFERSSSIFRACFKQVAPEPYMKMCVSDLSAVHENQFDSTICTTAGAYWAECRIHGVPLKMPKSCVRCETADEKEMTEGDVMKFTKDDPLHVSDVVFVVEEKPCNQEKYRMLIKLAQAIEEGLGKKGFRDIRYSVVGFGGDTIHSKPHIHTMDGQISGTVRAVESAFQSLAVGNGADNVLEALRYAAALPFRPGTTKNFILLKCSTCKAEEVRAEYSEMLRTLLDGDITLHLLMEQKFELKMTNKNSKAKKVIGIDRNFAFTLKDVKDSDLSGDGDMLAQLKIPKDVCVPLALEVNGSSFDSQQLIDMKKRTYKKFIDILARRIQKSASERSEFAMCCECISTVEGIGKSMCQRCVSAEVANMISPESSPFYNDMSNSIHDPNYES